MTTMLHSGNNAMPLGNDAMSPCKNLMPLSAHSVTTMLCSGDDTNLGNVTTPLGAHSVMTTPRLGNDAPPLGDDTMPLGNNPLPFGENPMPLGARSARTAMTTLCLGKDTILGEVPSPFGACSVT